MLDDCEGQPDSHNKYHYHAVSDCIGVGDTDLLGYAFDGFKIYGTREENGDEPTGLDTCNGHYDEEKGQYHYHTMVGNHTVSIIGCFRGQPIWSNMKQGEEHATKDLCKED